VNLQQLWDATPEVGPRSHCSASRREPYRTLVQNPWFMYEVVGQVCGPMRHLVPLLGSASCQATALYERYPPCRGAIAVVAAQTLRL
jgi:hypothetical protein